MNTTDSKKSFQTIVKGRTIYKYFRLKVEEYLRTASFKSYLLVAIKKECTKKSCYCERTNTTNALCVSIFAIIRMNFYLFPVFWWLGSTIIRINFDTFSSIFGDLVVKLKVSKLQNYPWVNTRAGALATVDYVVKI